MCWLKKEIIGVLGDRGHCSVPDSPDLEYLHSGRFGCKYWLKEEDSKKSTGPGKLLLVGVCDFADLRPKIRQTLAPFFVDLRA